MKFFRFFFNKLKLDSDEDMLNESSSIRFIFGLIIVFLDHLTKGSAIRIIKSKNEEILKMGSIIRTQNFSLFNLIK